MVNHRALRNLHRNVVRGDVELHVKHIQRVIAIFLLLLLEILHALHGLNVEPLCLEALDDERLGDAVFLKNDNRRARRRHFDLQEQHRLANRLEQRQGFVGKNLLEPLELGGIVFTDGNHNIELFLELEQDMRDGNDGRILKFIIGAHREKQGLQLEAANARGTALYHATNLLFFGAA